MWEGALTGLEPKSGYRPSQTSQTFVTSWLVPRMPHEYAQGNGGVSWGVRPSLQTQPIREGLGTLHPPLCSFLGGCVAAAGHAGEVSTALAPW